VLAVARRHFSDLTLTFRPDELYRVPTDDGASIALGRYHARTKRRAVEPVVLCHGFGANRFSLDFDSRYSLARYLAARGFETWVLELRGRGLAGPVRPCTFDDQAEYDVRAALRAVRGAGHREVLWVGHSKGGMLMYAHLARNPNAPVKSVVTLASAGSFGYQTGMKLFVERVAPFLKMDVIPFRVVRRLARLGPLPGPISRYLSRAENMEPETIMKITANMVSDLAGGVARQFARWIRLGTFDSADGSFNYRVAMENVKTPFLLMAGSADLMAPEVAVEAARRALGGPTELVVVGKGTGFREDYGHGDIVLGRHAPDEVFPLVDDYLRAHSTPV
jgi:alpha-beta hydrolase superfamily lysophospholipase